MLTFGPDCPEQWAVSYVERAIIRPAPPVPWRLAFPRYIIRAGAGCCCLQADLDGNRPVVSTDARSAGGERARRNLFLKREADVLRRLLAIHLLLLLALLIRGLRLIAGILRMLLSLRRMILALGMVIFAMSICSGTMSLRCIVVMFRRLVVFVLHGVFSLLAEECRLIGNMVLTAASATRQ